MSSREELIARKQDVRRQIERAQRQLTLPLRVSQKPRHREVRKLEDEIERLTAEESSLRVAIDQSA